MADGYELREHDLGCGLSMLVLAPVGRPDFIEEMRLDRKRQDRFKCIKRTMMHLCEGCVESESFVGNIRSIDPNLSLVEIRVGGTVIRLMAYRDGSGERTRFVLLLEFEGHQGSSRIPKQTLAKARRLARSARDAMRGE